MNDQIPKNDSNDGIDRRGFLKCMAWAGTGVLWTVSGGALQSRVLGADTNAAEAKADFSFVQISDSHIGFSKEPNQNVVATLQQAIARINALPAKPDMLIHTRDLTHVPKPAEFDTADKPLRDAEVAQT